MKTGNVYVVRRNDGSFFIGCGYGGPGHPVPYWDNMIQNAQLYKSVAGAMAAARRWGGFVGLAEVGADGVSVRWVGFLVRQLGEWRAVPVNPLEFDPQDYEGNNGPIRME